MHIIGKVFVWTFQFLVKHFDILNHSSTGALYLEPSPKNWVIIFDEKTYLLKWFLIFLKPISFERGMNEIIVVQIWFGLFSCSYHNFIFKLKKQAGNAQNLTGVAHTTLFELIFLPWRNAATLAIYTWLDSQNAILSWYEDKVVKEVTTSPHGNQSPPC